MNNIQSPEWSTLPALDVWHGNSDNMPTLTNPIVAKAYAVAVNGHSGISRKTGEPYVNHPLRVSQRLDNAGYSASHVATALLHDVVEDTELTLSDLANIGFSDAIVEAVDSVTKRPGETYPEAVERASLNEVGRLVKLADNLDNSSPEQLLPFTPEKRAKQIQKYAPARVTLLVSITGGIILDPLAVFTQKYRSTYLP